MNTAKMTNEEIDAIDYFSEGEKNLAKELNGLSDEDKDFLFLIETLVFHDFRGIKKWAVGIMSSLWHFIPDSDIRLAYKKGKDGKLIYRKLDWEATEKAEKEDPNHLGVYVDIEITPTNMVQDLALYCFDKFDLKLYDYVRCGIGQNILHDSIFKIFLFIFRNIGDKKKEELKLQYPKFFKKNND